MGQLFHVTSCRNRPSIDAHGLDWRRMGATRGIAGSTRPEVAGVFVCTSESDVDFLIRINNTGGPVDVWAVDGIDDELVESGSGYSYLPRAIPRAAITLIRQDIPVPPVPKGSDNVGFSSTLTLTLDDGTVLPAQAVREIVGDP